MFNLFRHKRGATFDMTGQIVASGTTVAPSFTGLVGSAQVRTLSDTLVDNLTFQWVDINQRIVRISKESTASWPLGVVELDIRFADVLSNVYVYTETVQFQVVKDVTHGT